MAEERRRRRRRARGTRQPSPAGEPPREEQPPDLPDSEKRDEPPAPLSPATGPATSRRRPSRRQPVRAHPPASPLGFWRRTRTRSLRPTTDGRGTGRGVFGRFYFPPWAPVAAVIVLVSGILIAVIALRETATAAPKIADHWHARYDVVICGEEKPDIPALSNPEGVHTHGDGLIHIHPFIASAEGAGARLVKWMEYLGGEMNSDSLRLPTEEETYRTGDLCSDGQPGTLQVFANGIKREDFDRYIPQDGDSVRIIFGPVVEAPPPTKGIVIPPEQATREVTIDSGDSGLGAADGFFRPASLTSRAGETVKMIMRNTGRVTHNLRVAGADGLYNTEDDFVSDLVRPGEEGSLVVRIDQPGAYPFRCDVHQQVHLGTIIVEAPAATPTP